MNILQKRGILYKLSRPARPLVRFGHLSEPLSVTFITAFGSPSAASGMLRNLYDSGSIEKRELVIGVLVNAFPVMVMEARFMLPVMISFLGHVGLLIFFILLVFRLVQTLIVLLISRILLEEKTYTGKRGGEETEPLKGKELLRESLRGTVPTLRRIILISVPVSLVTFTLLHYGIFITLSHKIQDLSKVLPVPLEGMSVIAAYFGHYVAGYTVAGNILSENILSVKEITITILTAKVLSSFVFTLRHSIPYYIGIFGSKTGLQIMSLSLTLRNLVTVSGIFVLYYLW
ncbi:MAG: hypothetical protein GY754_14710 [bacterium]|nr:hypothetical protein [bacterium]